MDHWVFNEFERVAPFQEFRDDVQFAEVASHLAERAASQVLVLRQKFNSIEAVAAYLTQTPTGEFWQDYQAGIAASLVGDTSTAAARFQAVASIPATAAWIGEAQARAQRLFDSFTSMTRARELVAAEVALTREKLGLPALPADADLWAQAGRVTV